MFTPRDFNSLSRASFCAAVTISKLLPSRRRALSAISRRLSNRIRSGWRSHGTSRTVSCGSSAISVPMPVMTAHASARMRCTSRLASAPVIHFDCPFANAVLPSRLAATFSVTQGLPRVTRFRKARNWKRTTFSIKPVSTMMPASLRRECPPPSTPSKGSCTADTTLHTFAATSKSAQAGPRDAGCRQHGSSVA